MKNLITAERLRELLDYDPDTGIFVWRVKTNRRITIGSVAGVIFRGRNQIRLDGRAYRAHRLAWLHIYGDWPQNEIDHINGNAMDNRIVNLRDITHRLNLQNKRAALNRNKLGILGVRKNVHGDKFCARIDNVYLGSFDTPEEAHKIYVIAKRERHEGCTL